MPVVTLNLKRLERLVGGKAAKSKIIEALPFLGLDIEEETKEFIRVEYSPNRPDYATDVGVAAGLQGLFGTKKGTEKLDIKKSDKLALIKTDAATKKLRPYICGIIAKDGNLDDETIKQLIALQEDLHFGVGRRRKKASVGIHDLDKVSLPLKYTAVSRDHKFVPLTMNEEMSVEQILAKMDVGRNYGHLLEGKPVPVILDSKKNTISLPPIINSALTAVSARTKNLLVEVTGTDKNATEDTLAVVATTLHGLGFTLYDLKTDARGSSQIFKTRPMMLDSDLVNQILGMKMAPSAICNYLKKCRLDATTRGKKINCNIPRFRFDIFGPMDLIEEVALGYGIQNLTTSLPASTAVGQKNAATKKFDQLSQIMTGLGFTEVLNSSLTSRHILYDATKRDLSEMIEVLESKSQEHTILRDSILPGMLENLSRNIHESYPQKLFETGTIFSKGSPIKESISMACLSAHKDTSFTEIKAALQSLLKTDSNIECSTKTSTNPMFAKGKSADVLVGEKKVGVIGEVDPQIIDSFKIRVPVCGFEINLSDFLL
jgi:phenylalanyl-tRNA synthetase beta chain